MARSRNRLEGADESTIAQYLKERIYVTLTGLAIVLVYANAVEHHTAVDALLSLVVGVVSITAAGYLSDVIAHLAVHQHFPTGADQLRLARVAAGALSTLITPVILLTLAVAEVMQLETSLRVVTIVYVVTLAAIGLGAVRRSTLPGWARLLVLAALVAFGALVVGLQVLAHSA